MLHGQRFSIYLHLLQFLCSTFLLVSHTSHVGSFYFKVYIYSFPSECLSEGSSQRCLFLQNSLAGRQFRADLCPLSTWNVSSHYLLASFAPVQSCPQSNHCSFVGHLRILSGDLQKTQASPPARRSSSHWRARTGARWGFSKKRGNWKPFTTASD